MQDKVLSLLGLAAKAGKLVTGGFSVEEAVKSRKARVVILAADAQQNTVKKFTDKCRHNNIPLRFYGTKEELGRAAGKETRACAAVTDRGFAQSLLKKLDLVNPEPPDSSVEPPDSSVEPPDSSALIQGETGQTSVRGLTDETPERGSPDIQIFPEDNKEKENKNREKKVRKNKESRKAADDSGNGSDYNRKRHLRPPLS